MKFIQTSLDDLESGKAFSLLVSEQGGHNVLCEETAKGSLYYIPL